jgi:hypothetical protein
MKESLARGRIQPWRNALIATTGLSALLVISSLLWDSGYPQWAFILAFLAIWAVISVSWSNMKFTEESGSILAGIVDHNFRNLHEKIDLIEKELAAVKEDQQAITTGASSDQSLHPGAP